MEPVSDDLSPKEGPVNSTPPDTPVEDPKRRQFIQGAACVALGGLATLGPLAAGITVLVSPAFKKSAGGVLVRIAAVHDLDVGGEPHLFRVLAERIDAWTRFSQTAVGSVFLQRVGEGEAPDDFVAFNASCPHLGCAVEFSEGDDAFWCPCHGSAFSRDGKIADPHSPSPRGLDSLELEVRNGEVWVKFVNFKAGTKEKIPEV